MGRAKNKEMREDVNVNESEEIYEPIKEVEQANQETNEQEEQNKKDFLQLISCMRAAYKYFPKKFRNDLLLEECISLCLRDVKPHKKVAKIKAFKKTYKFVKQMFDDFSTDETFANCILSETTVDDIKGGVLFIGWKGVKKYAKKLVKKYAKCVGLNTLPKSEGPLEECFEAIENVRHIKAKHKVILRHVWTED